MESRFVVSVEADERKYEALVNKLTKLGEQAETLQGKFLAIGGGFDDKAIKSVTGAFGEAVSGLNAASKELKATLNAIGREVNVTLKNVTSAVNSTSQAAAKAASSVQASTNQLKQSAQAAADAAKLAAAAPAAAPAPAKTGGGWSHADTLRMMGSNQYEIARQFADNPQRLKKTERQIKLQNIFGEMGLEQITAKFETLDKFYNEMARELGVSRRTILRDLDEINQRAAQVNKSIHDVGRIMGEVAPKSAGPGASFDEQTAEVTNVARYRELRDRRIREGNQALINQAGARDDADLDFEQSQWSGSQSMDRFQAQMRKVREQNEAVIQEQYEAWFAQAELEERTLAARQANNKKIENLYFQTLQEEAAASQRRFDLQMQTERERNSRIMNVEWELQKGAVALADKRQKEAKVAEEAAWQAAREEQAASDRRFQAQMKNIAQQRQAEIHYQMEVRPALEEAERNYAALAKQQKKTADRIKATLENDPVPAAIAAASGGGLRAGGGGGGGGGGGAAGGGKRGFFDQMFFAGQPGMGGMNNFDRFGIKMSGYAATFFVAQMVTQYIAQFMQAVLQYEKGLIDIRAQLNLTEEATAKFDKTVKTLASTIKSSYGGTQEMMGVFMKLGYGIDQSANLAKNAIQKQKEDEKGTLTGSINQLSDNWERFKMVLTGSDGPVSLFQQTIDDLAKGLDSSCDQVQWIYDRITDTKNWLKKKMEDAGQQAQSPEVRYTENERAMDAASGRKSGLPADFFNPPEPAWSFGGSPSYNRLRQSERESAPFITSVNRGIATPTGKEFLDSIIAEASSTYGVPEQVIRAVIQNESTWNPKATSNKGAMGLMQLMPGTASDYGVTNAYDPRQNIMAGTRILARQLLKSGGDVAGAAAFYNAGTSLTDVNEALRRANPKYVAAVARDAGGLPVNLNQLNPAYGVHQLPGDIMKQQGLQLAGQAGSMWLDYWGTPRQGSKESRMTSMSTTLSSLYGAEDTGKLNEVLDWQSRKFDLDDLKPRIEVWEKYYQVLNEMGEGYYKAEQDRIQLEFEDNAKKDPVQAAIIKRESQYQLDEKNNKGHIADMKNVYDTLGTYSADYYEEQKKLIEHERTLMLDRAKGDKEQIGWANDIYNRGRYDIETEKEMADQYQMTTPRMNKLMQLFNSTGYMGGKLFAAKEFQAARRLESPRWEGEDDESRYAQYYQDRIQNYKDFKKREIEIDESYRQQTGVMSDEIYAYKKNLIDLETKFYATRTKDKERAEKLGNARLLALDIEANDAKLNILESAAQESGRYVTGLFELQERAIDLHIQQLKQKGIDPQTIDRIERRGRMRNWVNTLTSKDEMPGAKDIGGAVWRNIELNSETISSKVVGIWTQAAYDIEAAWKDNFFSIMSADWKNWQDTAIGAIQVVHRAMSDMLYEMIKNGLKTSMTPMLNNLFGTGNTTGAAATEAGSEAAVGGWGSTTGSIGVSYVHGGGVIGIDSLRRGSIPLAAFANAPRFHNGMVPFKPGEYPAVLKQGESVMTPAQMKAMGGGSQTSVTVNNYTGQQVQTKESQGPDGMRNIEVLIGQALTKDGPASRALRQTYGLNRKATVRG